MNQRTRHLRLAQAEETARQMRALTGVMARELMLAEWPQGLVRTLPTKKARMYLLMQRPEPPTDTTEPE